MSNIQCTKGYILRRSHVELYGQVYDAPALGELVGQRIRVRYDLANVDRVAVYDMEQRFLCEATHCERGPLSVAEEGGRRLAIVRAKRSVTRIASRSV